MLSRLGEKFDKLHPQVKRAALDIIDELAQDGIFVGIPHNGAWRSIEGQRDVSDGSNVDESGDLRNSYHVWGLAVDFVPINVAGHFYWPDASDAVWQKIGAAIKRHGGEWGGDWRTLFDGPHAQFPAFGGRLAALKSTYSNPAHYVAQHEGRYA